MQASIDEPSEAMKLAQLWRFQARLTNTHLGFTAKDWQRGVVTPFDYVAAFTVVQQLAALDGRLCWDSLR